MINTIQGLENIGTWQTELAGQTLDWLGEDNKESYEEKLKDPIKVEMLKSSGWLDRSLQYKYNSIGFRGPELDADIPHFCAFGDSVTGGTALGYDQIYSSIIAEKLGLTCFNFGTPGGSDSTSFRYALTYLPKLKPKFVIYQQTFAHRFEWIEQVRTRTASYDVLQGVIYGVQAHGGGTPPTTVDKLYQHWINVDANSKLLAAKNLYAMKQLCQELDIKLIVIHIDDFRSPMDDKGRDLLHPGPKIHQEQADKIIKLLTA